uniref:Glycosyltransferase family 1 protein n=1 Tax=Thermodesulfobacterium geofontis TaxID=1295609 RepID=A0A7V5XFI1_9BACT
MVIINSKFLVQNITGVQRFAFNVAIKLAKLKNDNLLFFMPNKKFNYFYENLFKENIPIIKGYTRGIIWEQIELPFFAKRKKAIILNLGNSGPIFYNKNVTIIHDLLWLKYPEAYSKLFTKWYSFMIPRLIKNSLKVITVSQTSKRDIVDHFKIAEDKIAVIYPGVDRSVFKPLNLERENFILWVGSLKFYKNVHGLIEAFKILKQNYKIPYKLTIAGYGVGELRGKIDEKIRDDVDFVDKVKDEILLKLYNRALVFVFPSFYEGFGLPPLEAMACGCPVVVSDTGGLPEVCGDAGIYCNPQDPYDIARAIYEVISSKELRGSLIKKGLERANLFSWEKTAREILNIVKELL